MTEQDLILRNLIALMQWAVTGEPVSSSARRELLNQIKRTQDHLAGKEPRL